MLRSVLIMLVGMSLIPTGDTAGKLLSTIYGVEPFFIGFSRFVVGALLVLPFVFRADLRVLGNWRLWLRAALLCGGIMSILTALKTVPLADAFGAFFIGPLFSYVLSSLLLKEPSSTARTLLLILGFAGVLMVVQPGADMSPDILFAVLAGLFYGAFLTASKWVVHLAPPRVLVFSQLAIASLLTAPLGLSALPAVTPEIAVLTLASGAASMAGNLLLIFAYSRSPSTKLAPFVYFQIIAATVLGWAVFGTFPNTVAICGMALLISAGFATLALRR